MNKTVIFIIFFLTLAKPLAGQAVENKNQPTPETEAALPAPNNPAAPAPKAQPTLKPKPADNENWPRPFVPSERINADSVVSFPIDI